MATMVFDIETIPDVELGRDLFGLEGVSDNDTAKAMAFHNLQERGTEFLPLPQHRVVAISVAWRGPDGFKVWTIGEEDSSEAEIIQRFYDGIEKFTPELVSWNGGGFDLPVLHYRGLKNNIQAPRYWDTGDNDREFKWNNYLSRFHWRHLDLMDVLSGYQPRARASLDTIATMLGYPGKLGMDGSKVWDAYRNGDLKAIRDYCEHDVLNTYLVYLRFKFMRGDYDQVQLDAEIDKVRATLNDSDAPHLQEFADAWLASEQKQKGQ